MTFKEYENLCTGDKVRLPFSISPDQIVVKAGGGDVVTVPEGYSAHMVATYTNRYTDIELKQE